MSATEQTARAELWMDENADWLRDWLRRSLNALDLDSRAASQEAPKA